MDWNNILLTIMSALFGGGGGAALYRAYGQTRNEVITQKLDAAASFRDAILKRVAQLEETTNTLGTQNDELIKTNAKLEAKIMIYDSKFEIQANQIQLQANQIDDLKQRLTAVMLENDLLKRENAEQKARLSALERGGMHG